MGIILSVFEPLTAGSAEFKHVGQTKKATKIETTDKLFEGGTFTIEMQSGIRLAQLAAVGQLVCINNEFWGVIKDLQRYAGSSGLTTTVSGWQLKRLTEGRITIPPDENGSGLVGTQGYDVKKGATETVMKHFVNVNMGEGAATNRFVYGLTIASDLGRGVADDKYMTRHDNLGSVVLKELGEASGLGYDVKPDLKNNTYIYDVIKGADRSINQSDVPPVVFSLERRTVTSQTYVYNSSDAKNTFYATMSGAEYADEALTMLYYREDEDTPKGINRVEQHMTINSDTPTAGEEYNELKRLALIQAEGYRPAESFTSDVTDSRFKFGGDYFLGDTVTARNNGWGISKDPQVTEMKTVYASSGVTRTATFGTAPLNIFGWIKKQIKRS